MLDVGAVAQRMLRGAGFDEPMRQALTLLIALHDIGKIGAEFRAMLLDGSTQGSRHWEVSLAWLMYFDEPLLAPLLGSEPLRRAPLYAAVAGHHGRPSSSDHSTWEQMRARAGPDAERDAADAIAEVADLFPQASLRGLELTFRKAASWREGAKPLSWWLAGLTSLADWIGSNTEWFPARAPDLTIPEYWAQAQQQAELALKDSGLEGAAPSDITSSEVFSFPDFTPMQRAVLDASLPEVQTLAIIEDATGSGKTEASLMLAHRMMKEGRGNGLFFALPTMATANAMFGRLQSMRRLFDGEPSLALAHGRAGLHEGFREIQGRRSGEPDAMSCAPWLADGRRKALLAQVGVGTIDQTLLGVLPTRFSALRLYALSQRILIIDEAHDYDRYMQTGLERLLTFHAMLGGSAILMTATLPPNMRAQLVRAFRLGAKQDVGATELPDSYPQISFVGTKSTSIPVEAVPTTRRSVAVTRLSSFDEALDVLCDATARGAACTFVRNSVDEAITAVETLRERGIEAMLHHARFALCDRLDNEKKVLDRFGKNGERREGTVIVGTQVLEQSLDIDVDVLVSDLAPIGALIQRAGRLWRHMTKRPTRSRPVERPILHVLSPDPCDANQADWSRDLLGRGFYVYPLPDQWCTAKALCETGAIDAPDGLRALIAAVYGDDAPDVPEALVKAQNEREGALAAEHSLALGNVLDASQDYRSAGKCSEETFPTRLAPEQAVLALARRTSDGLVPYAEASKPEEAWALSEVSISLTRWQQSGGVDQNLPDILAAKKDWPDWKKAKVFVCPVESDDKINSSIEYSRNMGLIFL